MRSALQPTLKTARRWQISVMNVCRYQTLGVLWLTLLVAWPSWALRFSPAIDQSAWAVQGNQFECRIAQSIPDFGQAIFYHQAGETQQFYLMADTPRMKTGRAALRITNPEWKPGGRIEHVGYVDVAEQQEAINLTEQQANQLLHALFEGRQVEFIRRAWYDERESINVGISNVNFRGAYDQYVGCLAELLPVNYGQIERTSLMFSPGQESLGETETTQLDNILIYSQADESVLSYFVDGHSDSRGSRAENMEVSKRRAKMVMDYLVDGGLSPDAIILRWHGERYPIASNRTADGRAQNRRVTVRLSKQPPPELPNFQMDEPGSESGPELDLENLFNSAQADGNSSPNGPANGDPNAQQDTDNN